MVVNTIENASIGDGIKENTTIHKCSFFCDINLVYSLTRGELQSHYLLFLLFFALFAYWNGGFNPETKTNGKTSIFGN